MQEKRYVSYIRVSTARQGESGLGIEAQRHAVSVFIGNQSECIAEFVEMESGRKNNRPMLNEALALCRKKRATLAIARLDRLARSVFFISNLMDSGVDFIAADQPTKDRFMLHLQAAFAEEEARRISERTKAALKAAKARGTVLGATGRARAREYQKKAQEAAEAYRSVVESLAQNGITTARGVRDELNRMGVPSPGGQKWHLPNTFRMLKRLNRQPDQLDGSGAI